MQVISLVSQKGGVGKTTVSISFSACLALNGHRTLLIDSDPQASATISLGFDPSPLALDVLLGKVDPIDIIRNTSREKLDILPAARDLALFKGRQDRLKEIVGTFRRRYDFVIIDAPTGLNLLSVNAILACQRLIIPVLATFLSLESVRQVIAIVDRVNPKLNPGRIAVLPNMIDVRRNLTHQVLKVLRARFKVLLVIPVCVALAESQSQGVDVFKYQSWSTGAQAYKELPEELSKW